MASLKEQLEEKECEVKRLQERLVCKAKGEGIEVLDRGKADCGTRWFHCNPVNCRRESAVGQ